MSDPAIFVQGVSKAYRIWDNPAARLTAPLLEAVAGVLPGATANWTRRKASKRYRDFWALKDISFELNRGEAVGIIGRNGSGKSTLLQIIAGTLQPTEGNVQVNGRVAALLELGSGFNPEFTGRENVHLSASVLGLTRAEIDARFNDITAFADIGDFIDQPVKTYSSGMMVRLAFAVNTCVDPDILIVDEALSVGDAPFQAKCFRRLRQLIDKGVSLLFVSHDIGTVRSICSRALWLKGGRVEMWGEAKEVAREYEKFCWREQGIVFEETDTSVVKENTAVTAKDVAEAENRGDHTVESKTGEPPAILSTSIPSHAAQADTAMTAAVTGKDIAGAETRGDFTVEPETGEPPAILFTSTLSHVAQANDGRYGTRAVTIENLVCTNNRNEPATHFGFNEVITLHYLLSVHREVDSDIIIGVRIKDTKDDFLFSTQDIIHQHRISAAAGDRFYARTSFRLPLTHDKYLIKTGIFGFIEGDSRPGGKYDYSQAVLWDIIENSCVIEVAPHPAMPLVGPVHAHADLIIQSLPAVKKK
jgi:ABC-type polysaccharide/polyol phosphate transport system ATPase subunit